MGIAKLHIGNFKSFESLDVELGPFNVVVGRNASGKSNLAEAFRFLNHVKDNDLEQAIAMQGGVEYFRNINIGSAKPFELELVSDNDFGITRKRTVEHGREEWIGLHVKETKYRLRVAFTSSGKGFKIIEDSLQFSGQLDRLAGEDPNRLRIAGKYGPGSIKVENIEGEIRTEVTPKEYGFGLEPLMNERLGKRFLHTTPLISILYFMPYEVYVNAIDEIAVYSLDPRTAKLAVPLTGVSTLESDGGNLALVLRRILKNPRTRKKFFNLVRPLLPFVADLMTESFSDKSRFFRLEEVYSRKAFLPASLLSDGTVDILGMVAALYFESQDVAVFEEPDRNMHPHLVSQLVAMMKDASKNKQIILTTHSPLVVKHAGLENLYLISRDQSGVSRIDKPAGREKVRAFLEDEIGIESLFVQDLLGL